MPEYWYSKFAVAKLDESERDFNRAILADKKPYFMCYIYPALMREYKKFMKSADRNALREFGKTTAELLALPYSELTGRQKEFLHYFDLNLPVGTGNCVINRICRRFEEVFDGYFKKNKPGSFNPEIMKSGVQYTPTQKSKIKKLYQVYNSSLQEFVIRANRERIDRDESLARLEGERFEFLRECYSVCSNDEQLCEILLDVCYTNSKSKKFAWDVCASQIIKNLLANNNNLIRFPAQSPEGELIVDDLNFEIKSVVLEETGGELDDHFDEEQICGGTLTE